MPADMREGSSSGSAALQDGCLSADRSSGQYPLWSYGRVFKRWADVALTVLFLPLILPFALVVSFLIKLDSQGPVLVKLKRLGKDHAGFYKYKFRTMVPDAERVLQELLRSDEKLRRGAQTNRSDAALAPRRRFAKLSPRTHAADQEDLWVSCRARRRPSVAPLP